MFWFKVFIFLRLMFSIYKLNKCWGQIFVCAKEAQFNKEFPLEKFVLIFIHISWQQLRASNGFCCTSLNILYGAYYNFLFTVVTSVTKTVTRWAARWLLQIYSGFRVQRVWLLVHIFHPKNNCFFFLFKANRLSRNFSSSTHFDKILFDCLLFR